MNAPQLLPQRVLAALELADHPLTVFEIAERYGWRVGTVRGIVNAHARLGLVERAGLDRSRPGRPRVTWRVVP